MTEVPILWTVPIGLALLLLLIAVRVLWIRRRYRIHGTLVWTDRSDQPGTLYSDRYRLLGRPDEIRRLSDGRPVPVEFKSRALPRSGVPHSHIVQVAAYCLLLEEATGRIPPYGVLRYVGGPEVRIPWDAGARREVLRLREAVRRPYDGRATPSPARCRRCPWRLGCDQRAV